MRAGLIPTRGLARQARADAATLAVTGLVVALAAFLATALPRATALVATDEVRESVGAAGDASDVVITVPLRGSQGEGYELNMYTADDAEYVRDVLAEHLPPPLGEVVAAPITVIESPELKAGVIDGLPGRARMTYVDSEAGPALEWVEGRAPVATGEPDDLLYADGGFLPIEVALSEHTAALMGVGVGDPLTVENPDGVLLEVWVAGVFRPADPHDAAWRVQPQLLEPRVTRGSAGRVSVSMLVTARSLPFARLAMFPASMTRNYTFPVVAEAFTGASAPQVATEMRGVASGKQVFPLTGGEPVVTTRLDRVLDEATGRVAAGGAQSAVLLIGVLVIAALVELLAASVLMERRERIIGQWRARGATLPAVGAALAIESFAVTALAGGAGMLAGAWLVPGAFPLAWVLAPLATAALAAPLLGVVAGSRFLPRRAALGRRKGLSPSQVRRTAFEALLVALAAGSAVALRTRGASGSASVVASDVAVLAAPVLTALAIAALSLRLGGPMSRAARSLAARSRGATALLAAARVRASALPTLALVVALAMGTFAATAALTVRQGQVDAAWEIVGADASAHADPGRELPADVAGLPGAPGLTVATAAVLPSAQLIGPQVDEPARIVVIDAAAMAELLDASGRADGSPLRELARVASSFDAGGTVPILVSGAPASLDGVSLRWNGTAIPVERVAGAPDLPLDEAKPLTIMVDRTSFEEAFAVEAGATDAWASGPGAFAALAASVGDAKATVTGRDEWLMDARDAPVARALGWLFAGTAGLAVVMAVLAVALMAASSAWERARAVAGFRVVGTRRAAAERVAWLEVAAPVGAASVLGAVAGVGVSIALTGALGLASLTGQPVAPDVVVPWWVVLGPVVLTAAAPVAVWIAARSHGTERLGALMRVG